MPELRRLHDRLKPSSNDKRDAISAIVVAIQLISDHCKRLQYLKKIVLITNGTGSMDPDDIDDIATKVKNDGIELVILGVDFDDVEYGFVERDKSPIKARNERSFRELAEKSGGILGTMKEAIEELSIPRIKSVRPTATYKGELRLGSNDYDTAIFIQIERYPKVMRRTPPTASSFALKSDSSSQADGLTGVRSEYSYHVSDEEAPGGKRDIAREDLAKGYEYGRTAVHISESDENITKLETEAAYEILGFIPSDKVERYILMDNTSMIVAQKANPRASIALSSLIHALFELQSCAVAKLVKKDMSNPILTLLSASSEVDFECLFENQLPFAEDVRAYQFPPIDKVVTVSGNFLAQHRNLPSEALLSAMSDFVDSMDLTAKEDEDVDMEATFSPLYHRIEDAVKYRAVHTRDPVPPVSETLMRYSKPSDTLLSRSQSALNRLRNAADVKKVPPKVKGRKRYRDTEKPLSGLNVEELFQVEKKTKISADNAIPEFKQMLAATEDLDAVKDAMKQMTLIVEDQIRHSFADSAYGRALEGLGVMRQEMMELEEPILYNDMLRELKRKIMAGELGGNRKEMWMMIRSRRLGLIDTRLSEVADVTQEEAGAFMLAK